MVSFLQLAAEKNTIFVAARKMFGPSYFVTTLTALKLYLIMFKLQLKNRPGSTVRCEHTAVQCNLVHQKYDTPNNIQILKKIVIK